MNINLSESILTYLITHTGQIHTNKINQHYVTFLCFKSLDLLYAADNSIGESKNSNKYGDLL